MITSKSKSLKNINLKFPDLKPFENLRRQNSPQKWRNSIEGRRTSMRKNQITFLKLEMCAIGTPERLSKPFFRMKLESSISISLSPSSKRGWLNKTKTVKEMTTNMSSNSRKCVINPKSMDLQLSTLSLLKKSWRNYKQNLISDIPKSY